MESTTDKSAVEQSAENEARPLTDVQRRSGMRNVYIGQSLGVLLIMLLARSGFGTLFVVALGGSDFLAMMLGAMVGAVRILQIPVSLRVHPSHGKRFLLRCWLAYGLMMLVVAGLPYLIGTGSVSATIIVLSIFIAVAVGQAGSTFWFPILHDVVPAETRGRFFGKMRAAWSVTLFLAVIGSGFFLGKNPEIWRFQAVIAVGAILVLLRNIFISRIPTPSSSLGTDEDFGDWRKHIKSMLRRKKVVIFCLYFVVLGFCVGFLAQPLVLYMRAIGFDVRDNVVITAFTPLGMIFSVLIAGRFVDRFGTRIVFLVTHITLFFICLAIVGLGVALTSGAITMDHAKILLPISLIISGAVRAAAGLACTAQLFYLAPDRGRAFFLCLANLLIFTGPSLAPLTTGLILSIIGEKWSLNLGFVRLDIYQVLFLLAGISLLLIIKLLWKIDDIKPGATKKYK